jgi:NAD(P)-dependent dehydrogenase (short-subunit alcohol dehydrogenase family)
MKGKIVLITGSTDGIGKAAALELTRMGAKVILHGRNPGRCYRVLAEVQKASKGATPGCFAADLSSLKEVRKLAEDIRANTTKLDVMINNAGVFMTERRLTEDGFETTFAVNHLAPFLLTHLLCDLLTSNAPARIINVSSVSHQRARIDFENLQGEKEFTGYGAYALSKAANILTTYELAERLEASRVTVNCLHPGVINTKLLREGFGGMFGAPPTVGAATLVYLASAPEVGATTGRYFVKNREEETAPSTHDRAVRQQLWTVSEHLFGLS